MPLLENSLQQSTGSATKHEFILLEGVVHVPSSKITLFSRIGVNGIGLVDTGIRGQPFRLAALNFVADFTMARDLLVAYNALVGGPSLIMRRNDVVYPGYFNVLAVEEQDNPRRVEAVCGDVPPPFSLEASLTVRHETIWTLISA